MTVSVISSGIEPLGWAMTVSPRHRLDDAVAERLVEVDEVQERVGVAEDGRAFGGADRPDVAHPVAVEVRRDLLVEVALVVDDPGDDETAAGPRGDLDGVRRALVGVDPPEEEQVIARVRVEGERVGVDAMVDRGGVVQGGWRSASLIAT